MTQIENRGVGGALPLHGFRKVRTVGSQQQVIVIVQHHKGNNVNRKTLGHPPKCAEKCVTVVVGKKNSLLLISTRQHVIVCACVFDSQGPCQEQLIVDGWVKVKYNQ